MPSLLSSDKILLHARPANRDAAISAAGQLLVDTGHVAPDYVRAMLTRETLATTYLGNGVAVPHGTRESLAYVHAPGVSILHVPAGVDFGGGNTVRLVIGLAARGGEHLDILAALAEICSDEARLAQLLAVSSPEEMIAILQVGMPA